MIYLSQTTISAESYPDTRYVSSLQRGLWESDPINLKFKGFLSFTGSYLKTQIQKTIIPWGLNCTSIVYQKL